MKEKIKILALVLTLSMIGCKKREVNFNYSITVKDFYTNDVIEGQKVVLELCTENIWGGKPIYSCDLIDEKFTNDFGQVSFTGSFRRRKRNGHEVYSDSGNGYFWTMGRAIWPDSSNVVLHAKPFVIVQLAVTSSVSIDSLAIFVSVFQLHDRPHLEDFGIAANDSTTSTFLAVPEEEHVAEIRAYENESLVWTEVSIFFPSYDQNNLLEIKK